MSFAEEASTRGDHDKEFGLAEAAPGWSREQCHDPRIMAILGWMTPVELGFVSWFMREVYSGAGEAVELGCAFGRSTAATLLGMTANQKAAEKKLHVYDLMTFDWYLLQEYRKRPGCEDSGYELGDSFEDCFWVNVEPWRDRVHLCAGDIASCGWSGEPIEYLFVDIMKSWEATRGVIRGFFPFLIPGVSCVVHQDYKHPYSPQIILTMYRLRDYFEPLYTVTGGISSTVAFRCKQKLDRELVDAALSDGLCDLSSYSIGEIDSAFTYSMALVGDDPSEEQDLLKAARVVVYINLLADRPDFLRAASTIPSTHEFVRDRFRDFVEAGDQGAALPPVENGRHSRLFSRAKSRVRRLVRW